MNYEYEIEELKKRVEELEKMVSNSIFNKQQKDGQANRDKTKYMFEGKIYPKNRLVLAVVKKYATYNNPTYEELNGVFDKSLQGSLKVVELFDDANKRSDAGKRYFMREEDILNLHGKKAVVCTQWGIFNIVKFVKFAETLGFDIQTI